MNAFPLFAHCWLSTRAQPIWDPNTCIPFHFLGVNVFFNNFQNSCAPCEKKGQLKAMGTAHFCFQTFPTLFLCFFLEMWKESRNPNLWMCSEKTEVHCLVWLACYPGYHTQFCKLPIYWSLREELETFLMKCRKQSGAASETALSKVTTLPAYLSL